MISLAKQILKRLLPKPALRWRTQKLIASGLEPDLCLLANIRCHLARVKGGERFREYFSKNRTAIDVGACGGEYSCVMARMFGKVLSIEPTADMVSVLRRSLPRNCEIVGCAIGAESGSVSIRVPKIDGVRMNALSTIAGHSFEFSRIDTVDTDVVRQLTIDQLSLERKLEPSFVKIDVEGYEGQVLLGARKTIESCHPVIMIEIEKRHNRGYRDIFSSLGSLGYVPFHFQGGALLPSSPDIVEKAFDYLAGMGTAGMNDVISSKASEKYLNNFIFLPISSCR
jgi:FkbM family methyltransferase